MVLLPNGRRKRRVSRLDGLGERVVHGVSLRRPKRSPSDAPVMSITAKMTL
jgi:hypothetical protein